MAERIRLDVASGGAAAEVELQASQPSPVYADPHPGVGGPQTLAGDMASQMEGQWLYGKDGSAELYYELARIGPAELVYMEENMRATIALHVGAGEGTLVEHGQLQGTIRVLFKPALDVVVSNFRAVGEIDWGEDRVASRRV